MPKKDAVEASKKEWIKKILGILLHIAPLVLTEDAPRFASTGEDDEEAERGLELLLVAGGGLGDEPVEPHRFGGALTTTAIQAALRKLVSLAGENADSAAAWLGEALDRVSPVKLP